MNMGIRNIMYNEAKGTTTVVFTDGAVSVVKVAEGTAFDRYAGFTAAITKRVYGSGRTVNRLVEWGTDHKPKGK